MEIIIRDAAINIDWAGDGCVGTIRRNQKRQKVWANPPLASCGANQAAGQSKIVLLRIKTFEVTQHQPVREPGFDLENGV